MVSKPLLLASLTILLSVFYQLLLRDVIFIFIGVGRTYNRIEDFPYECRSLRDPLLESCEDLVLDTEGRRLYAACSTLRSREGWAPKLVPLFCLYNLVVCSGNLDFSCIVLRVVWVEQGLFEYPSHCEISRSFPLLNLFRFS